MLCRSCTRGQTGDTKLLPTEARLNPAGIEARTPQAGSYLFPRLPDLTVAPADFVRILRLQAGVVVTPGTEFSPHSAKSVRLNFSQDHAAALKAVERMVELIERYRA